MIDMVIRAAAMSEQTMKPGPDPRERQPAQAQHGNHHASAELTDEQRLRNCCMAILRGRR
jgi:hypothetical protein